MLLTTSMTTLVGPRKPTQSPWSGGVSWKPAMARFCASLSPSKLAANVAFAATVEALTSGAPPLRARAFGPRLLRLPLARSAGLRSGLYRKSFADAPASGDATEFRKFGLVARTWDAVAVP